MEAISAGTDWSAIFGNVVDAATQAYVAKQQNTRRPPPPTNMGGGSLGFGYPMATDAEGRVLTDQQKIAEIFRSPITWLALAAIAVGVIYFIRR